MSQDAEAAGGARATPVLEPWQSGAIGGIVGGALLAVLVTIQESAYLADELPQLYGLGPDAMAIGWMIQVAHLAVLGVVFVLVVEATSLDETLDDNFRNAVAGLVFGAVAWALVAAVLVPVWLGAVSDAGGSVPDVNTTIAVGYLAYGVVVGLTYSVLTD